MTPPAHIMVHDYAGHPFTAELARALALRGWRVSYVYFAGDGGPKGRNQKLPGDPDSFATVPLNIDGDYSKSNFLKRRQGDVAYGKRLAACVQDLRPDIILSGNTPTECQEHLCRATRATGAQFVYWCQDFYSIAASKILSRKIPGLGHLVGAWYTFLERRQMRQAAHVVHITDGFLKVTDGWGIPRARVSIIPNWGALDEIPLLPRANAWATEQGLTRPRRIVYSGTLARKHNPDLLLRLAQTAGDTTDVVVVGFGIGADYLAGHRDRPATLKVMPLQPFARLPEVLASADILAAVIEADAGEFSVPSKVLSYLCAGRPIVLAAPRDNLAARIVTETGAGLVVEPEDIDGFVASAMALLADPDRCTAMGRAGRAYAEETFNLDNVSARFEDLFATLGHSAPDSVA